MGDIMKLITRITDADSTNDLPISTDTEVRYSSRGILFNNKNEVAMMFIEAKNLYILPGGGVERNETNERAFLREILEETGYESEIIKELGIIEEYKIKTNYFQTSYCYVAKAIFMQQTNLTDREKSLGFKVVWMKLKDAIEVMDKAIEVCDDYKMKFILLRDKTILTIAKEGLV